MAEYCMLIMCERLRMEGNDGTRCEVLLVILEVVVDVGRREPYQDARAPFI